MLQRLTDCLQKNYKKKTASGAGNTQWTKHFAKQADCVISRTQFKCYLPFVPYLLITCFSELTLLSRLFNTVCDCFCVFVFIYFLLWKDCAQFWCTSTMTMKRPEWILALNNLPLNSPHELMRKEFTKSTFVFLSPNAVFFQFLPWSLEKEQPSLLLTTVEGENRVGRPGSMYEPSVTQWMCLCSLHCDSAPCDLHC